MAVKFSPGVRNARLDAIETAIGASAKLLIYSGAAPADTAAAATGTLLVSMDLPADYMAAAANGSKAKSGTWSGVGAAGAGAGTNAGYFRIAATNGTTIHMQGSISATGGGGDMTLDNISIANGQTVSINTFTLTEPGA